MPFITEEIWQKLPLLRPTDSIMVAPYPSPDARLLDAAAEQELAPVIAAIEGLRSIRGESNLPPAARVEAEIQSPSAELRATLEQWRHYLMPLAGLSQVRILPPGAKPRQSAAHVGQQLEIFVPLAGLIDLEAERGRLAKEISRVEAELAQLSKKLENPNFVARAPAEVVEKDRARVGELTARKAKLQDNLARIAPEAGVGGAEREPPSEVLGPGRVKIVGPSRDHSETVDLRAELKGELEGAQVPAPVDPQVKAALDQLREGTREGLTSSDHYDLGVAYMGMGLVDDAVREFNEAKKPAPKKLGKGQVPAAKKGASTKAKAAGAAAKKAAPKKAAAPKPATPAKKAAPARRPAAPTKRAAPARGASAAKPGGPAKKAASVKGPRPIAKVAPALQAPPPRKPGQRRAVAKALLKQAGKAVVSATRKAAGKAKAVVSKVKTTPARKGSAGKPGRSR
jgi:valyl-tRNA synthetase